MDKNTGLPRNTNVRNNPLKFYLFIFVKIDFPYFFCFTHGECYGGDLEGGNNISYNENRKFEIIYHFVLKIL